MLSRRRFLTTAAVGVASLGVGVEGGPRRVLSTAPAVTQLTREDGEGSLNNTGARWNVYGADLGHQFLYRGRMAMVFGDTFGPPAAADFFSVGHSDWRSNTMAWIDPPVDPTGGLRFTSMVSDQPGHAKELLPSLKVAGQEATVIPTYGTAVGDRLYLHYMSVNTWGAPGHWTLNYSGFGYSDDGGQTWTKDTTNVWPGDSNFGQVAIVEALGYLYFFGIPGGRYGGVQLARTRPPDVVDLSRYEYWDGSGWQSDPGRAATIVDAPVGELSVRWNSYYRRWLMAYLNDPLGQIWLRTAAALTGPWSPPKVVTTSATYPQLYAPYITPLWNSGPDIFFTMSLYGPYAVWLFKTRLQP